MEGNITTNRYKREPWIAATLSLIMPGLGHIYAGRMDKAIVLIFLLSICFPVFIVALGSEPSFMRALILGGMVAATSIIELIAIIDSCYVAQRAPSDYVPKDYNRWYVYILPILIATSGSVVVAFYFKEKCSEAFRVPAWSMYPAIRNNDRILANKMAYIKSDPRRGDVVVFRNPDNRRINYIKRVVAVAGDTVEMKNGELYINGKRLELQKISQSGEAASELKGSIFREVNGDAVYKIFLGEEPNSKIEALKDFGPVTVGKYNVFVLGDNRNSSLDSRTFGSIPIVGIKGKATFLYWPAKDWTGYGKIE